jgi:cob(I)alamin adenosyltransferase
MGSPVATVRSWGAAGASEGRKRVMSPSARRLLFVLLALYREGHDLDAIRSSARRLEREFLGDEDM